MESQRHTLAALDYLVVFAYLAAMMLMGVYFSRKQGSTDQYFAASRRVPIWAVGMSILATIISSVTFIAYPGTAYASNWLLLAQGLMVPVVMVWLVWFIVPAYRHAIGISAYEYFEKRFSYGARLYSSLAFSVVTVTKMGTITYLMATALASMTGWPPLVVIPIVGAATLIYTWIGGMDAVIWTDVVQGFLFLGGGVVCLGVILYTPAGGPSAIISDAFHAGKMSFGPYDLNFSRLTLVVVVLNGIFYALQNYTTSQHIVQRFLAAKDDRSAIKGALIGMTVCVPTWALFMFIGTGLWSFYRVSQYTLPAGITGDAVFPYFIMTQLPAGITGLVLAAILAAAMSTLSSDLNGVSSVVVEDYFRRLKPNATDYQRLLVGKGAVLVAGVVSIGVSLIYVWLGQASILATVFDLYAIFSGGIAGLFVLAFFTRRANRQGAMIGIVVCIVFTAWAILTSSNKRPPMINLGRFNFTQHSYMVGVYSHIVLFFVGYLASLFFPKPILAPNLTIHGWRNRGQSGLEPSGASHTDATNRPR